MTGAQAAPGHVDVHVHSSPPSFMRAVEDAPRSEARLAHVRLHAAALTDVSARLAGMDAAGVGLALLSVPPPAAEIDGPDAAGALAAAFDDELLEEASAHPDRFRVLLTLATSDPVAARKEIERLGDEPLVAGVYALAHHVERRLDDPALDEVWTAAAERGLPVLLHPAFEPQPPAFRDWALPTSLDAVFSTSVVAARLLLSGTLDRVPDLTLVVPHLGGTLPYVLQRLVDQSGTGDAEHDVAHYLRHQVLVDTCSYHPPALRCAVDTMGAERVLLGSDYPFRGSIARAVDDLQSSFLPAADRELVLGATAATTFRLDPGAPR